MNDRCDTIVNRNMLTEIILQIIKDLKWAASDVIFTDYYTSYKNLRRFLRYGEIPHSKEKIKSNQDSEDRQKFYNLLYQLRKQGFLKKNAADSKKTFFQITPKGLKHLKLLKIEKNFRWLKPKFKARKDYFKVVAFDIPEAKKRERDWLRHSLVNFNFSMLQKSVWIGDSQLPEIFFHSLRELDLLSYVHIFAVDKDKTGSLKDKVLNSPKKDLA